MFVAGVLLWRVRYRGVTVVQTDGLCGSGGAYCKPFLGGNTSKDQNFWVKKQYVRHY